MRSDELITAIRLAAFLPDSHADYTDARLLVEATDALRTVFERVVVNARQGYWLKTRQQACTAHLATYRIPPRAVVGGLEKVEIADQSGEFWHIPQCSAAETIYYEGLSTQYGSPARYWIKGDQIRLMPAPDSSSYTLRFGYYVRPSQLVTQQVSGTERGRVTAVDTTARTITVNAVPYDELLSTPAAITSANQQIDVVHPDGWHELALVGASQTLAGLVFTVGGTDDMSEIEVGDYVRAADQTDWPCLPNDFCRTLADACATVVMTSLHMIEKAEAVGQKVQSDLQRFSDVLQPRVKSAPRTIVARHAFVRRHRGWQWWGRGR